MSKSRKPRGKKNNGELTSPVQEEIPLDLATLEELPLEEQPLRLRINQFFLEYASYVIRDRAIPHLDDGLKPVQRRILWSLHRNDDGKFIKVANIVGYTMQFHPHGDASITEALIVLTNKRYLIEGQGNFGNIYTGDRAAASRYIECRLTPLARNHIFNDELTEFVPSYDGRNREPITLPAKLPLLLMLGTEGIAVGLSSKILPHNFPELLQAQIAILKKKPFQILPDFEKGGLMDAGNYDDGRGSIRVRARIRIKDKNTIVITEVPPTATSETIISSIEDAAKKGKIKVRSINDFTSEHIEIEIKLAAGMDADRTVQALYAFTDCEASISSRIILIENNRPVELTVSEVLRRNTAKLVRDLERELQIKEGKLNEELFFKTLVRIFIENRIYKKIESCQTNDAVFQAVHKGFEPHQQELWRDLTDDDVEMLLKVPIRRISLFDINRHKDEMEKLQRELDTVRKYLKNVVKYAIGHLEALYKEYAPAFPRLTEITSFEAVTAKEAAIKTLKFSYDRARGYAGFKVAGGEFEIPCSQIDKILYVREDGSYRVGQVEEKAYVGQNLVYCGLPDRDAVFVAIYQHNDVSYIKRFQFGGTIMNKEYQLAPPKSKLLYFAPDDYEELYLKYKPAKGQRIHEQLVHPRDLRVKSARSRGNQLTIKKVKSISSSKPRGWDAASASKIRFL